MRSAVNRSTGLTANKLMLGREVNVPVYLMFPNRFAKPVAVDEYVAALMNNIQTAHNAARSILEDSLKRMKRHYDVRILEHVYQEGDLVYLLDTAVKKGQSKKLSPSWKGPALGVKKISASLYRVKSRKAFLVVNHDRLKQHKDRTIPEWIREWLANPILDSEDTENDGTLYCVYRKPW